jgi:hypothetical protein
LSRATDIQFSEAIALVGAAILISSGWGLWTISAHLHQVETSEKPRCYQEVIINEERGRRSSTLFLTDQTGKRLNVCSGGECQYPGWGADIGKRAHVCYSGQVLLSAQVEGITRFTRADRLADMRDRLWLHKLMLTIGVLCIAMFTYIQRKRICRVLF